MNLIFVILICFLSTENNVGEITDVHPSQNLLDDSSLKKNNQEKRTDLEQSKSETVREKLADSSKTEINNINEKIHSTTEKISVKDTSTLKNKEEKPAVTNPVKNEHSKTKKDQNVSNDGSNKENQENKSQQIPQNNIPENTEDISQTLHEEPFIPSLPPTPTIPVSPPNEEDPYSSSANILLVSLGGGEDEILISQMAWLFYRHEKKVTVLLYGENQREESFPKGVKMINIPVDDSDPLRPEGKSVVGLTPEDSSRGEWASGRILWARIAACRHLVDVEAALKATKPSVVVSPLFLHDVCILALAHRLEVPVVGILTSRVGSWWTWAQLGVLPPLSTVAVPLTSLGEESLWNRAANLGHHYSYMSSLRQQWQVKAMNALPQSWNTPSLVDLYAKVSRLLLAWDPLVDPYVVPVPTTIPVGGFASTFRGEMTKDVLVPALLNRAGIVVVSAGTLEVWVGKTTLNALKEALSTTSFTVIWKAAHSHLVPKATSDEGKTKANFIFKKKVPFNDALNHPRHRLLVSTCGESDVMAAVHFGSPLLCLPVTTDQYLAATELKRLGLAEMLLPAYVTVGKLVELLSKLTSERSYRLRARELAEELHDQPLTPSERLIFHVENVVRRPHSVRYKIYGSNLPLLQQTNADVYLVLLILLAFIFTVFILTFIKVFPLVRKTLKTKKD